MVGKYIKVYVIYFGRKRVITSKKILYKNVKSTSVPTGGWGDETGPIGYDRELIGHRDSDWTRLDELSEGKDLLHQTSHGPFRERVHIPGKNLFRFG